MVVAADDLVLPAEHDLELRHGNDDAILQHGRRAGRGRIRIRADMLGPHGLAGARVDGMHRRVAAREHQQRHVAHPAERGAGAQRCAARRVVDPLQAGLVRDRDVDGVHRIRFGHRHEDVLADDGALRTHARRLGEADRPGQLHPGQLRLGEARLLGGEGARVVLVKSEMGDRRFARQVHRQAGCIALDRVGPVRRCYRRTDQVIDHLSALLGRKARSLCLHLALGQREVEELKAHLLQRVLGRRTRACGIVVAGGAILLVDRFAGMGRSHCHRCRRGRLDFCHNGRRNRRGRRRHDSGWRGLTGHQP